MLLLNKIDRDFIDNVEWNWDFYDYGYKEILLYKKRDCYTEDEIIANVKTFLSSYAKNDFSKVFDIVHDIILTDSDGNEHLGWLVVSWKHSNVSPNTDSNGNEYEFGIDISLSHFRIDNRWKIPYLTDNTFFQIYATIEDTERKDGQYVDDALKTILNFRNPSFVKKIGTGLIRECKDLMRFGGAAIETGWRFLTDRPVKYVRNEWTLSHGNAKCGYIFGNSQYNFDLFHFIEVCRRFIGRYTGILQTEISDNMIYPMTLTDKMGRQHNGYIRISDEGCAVPEKALNGRFFIDIAYTTPSRNEWTKLHNFYKLTINVDTNGIDDELLEMLESVVREIIEGYGRHKTPKELRFIDFEDPKDIEV